MIEVARPAGSRPRRPNRKARRYSTAWSRASGRRGARGWTTRPPRTVDPFATRIVPPAASTSGPLRNGRTIRSSASGSIRVSASIAQTSVAASPVEAGVERVRLAAVLLVHHDEVGMAGRAVDPSHRTGVQAPVVDGLNGKEAEFPLEHGEGLVLRPVVHQHHLQLRVVQGQQRPHALDHGGRLVVGRGQHAQPGRHLGAQQPPALLRPDPAPMVAHLQEGADQHGAQEAVDHRAVAQHEPLEAAEGRRDHARPPLTGARIPPGAGGKLQ